MRTFRAISVNRDGFNTRIGTLATNDRRRGKERKGERREKNDGITGGWRWLTKVIGGPRRGGERVPKGGNGDREGTGGLLGDCRMVEKVPKQG